MTDICKHCGGVDNWHHDLTVCVGKLRDRIRALEAELAAAKQLAEELVGARALIRELTDAQSDSENYWHIRAHGAERRERELGELYKAAEAELAELRRRDEDVRTVLDSEFIVSVGHGFDATNRTVGLWGKNCPNKPFTDDDVMKAFSAAAAWVREQKKGAGER